MRLLILLLFAQPLWSQDLSKGPAWFPEIYKPYQEQPLPRLNLENSPRLRDLIHQGALDISMSDAVALTLENNLDILVERFVVPIAQTDVLRTRSGQAARGFTGALVPGGLSAGALGAGVNSASSASGFGAAGGITGGGGPVQIPQVGSFDPTLSFNFSWDRTVSPLNTLQVAGVPSVTTYSTAFTSAYAQMFPTGTSYFVGINGLRQSSTQQFLRFNPAVISRIAFGVNQPLLNGFGLLPNERFLLVARNNRKVSEDLLTLQVIATIVNVQNLYWDMAAFQENVRVAEQSLDVAKRLLHENTIKAQVGTMAPLDVVTAESEVAARERDLIVARTNLQLQETRLKNALSKKPDPELDSVRVVTTDPLPPVRDSDIPDLEKALAGAYENRPELRQVQTNIQNERITSRYTSNNLMPGVALFGLYAGSGLQGNSVALAPGPPVPLTSGAGASLAEAFGFDFPERAAGVSVSLPIRNRAAQADDLRAQLDFDQLQVTQQRLHNQIDTEVRQAAVGLVQGKAQVEAAAKAVALARKTVEAEQIKLNAGISTSYNEILRERDLITAELAEVQARASYAKTLVEMGRATGTILDRNGIQLSDVITGENKPAPGIRK